MELNTQLGKTKVMMNQHANMAAVIVDGKTIEEVKSYVYIYLGRTVTKDCDLQSEIKWRIRLGWAAWEG